MLTNRAGMLEALVIPLCIGLEAALVIGALFAHLGLTGRVEIRRFVWFGLTVTLFQILGIRPDNEIYERTIRLIASMFVLTMIV